MILALAVGAFVVLCVAFVGVPLVRDEEDLEQIRSPLKSERTAADTDDHVEDVEYGPIAPTGQARCLRCGSVSDDSYRYCGQCLAALP